jgi:hypothetical protein
LAEAIGCSRRSVFYYALSSPRFAYQLFFGANRPATYRLCGVHAAATSARQMIEASDDRMRAPLTNRAVKEASVPILVLHYLLFLTFKNLFFCKL